MPSHTRQHASTETAPSTSTEAGPQTDGGDNAFLAALLSGAERLDDQAEVYFAHGIQFQKGMKGELVKRIQRGIGTKDDGDFGPNTENKLKLFQVAKGLPETGVVDEATWAEIQAATRTLANLQGEEDFAAMWEAHPHNYLEDQALNTASSELIAELGMRERDAPNTCALRMSTMMNRLGGDVALTRQKGIEAGLQNMRASGLYMPRVKDPKTDSTADRVILSARELWTYLEKHRGAPDMVWPPRGRYTEDEAKEGAKEVEAAVASRKGFIAFDKIFGYGGSGHVDIFNGTQLSDGSFYPAQRTMVWFVV